MKNQYAKEYGVKLYNQGFYKFGPMEQCDSGEWVRWADIEPFLKAAELRVQTAMETERTMANAYRLSSENAEGWKALYDDEAKVSRLLLKWNRALGFLSAAAMLVAAAQTIATIYGGA